MHMSMWLGYDLGEFMFQGLTIDAKWSFAITWIVLFVVAVLFEASKVYLARVQRQAQKKLHPFRSDERRNLLYEREAGMEPTTSRSLEPEASSRWKMQAPFKIRVLMNSLQSAVFVLHNLVGYLLMLAVMLYNVELMLAVVLGMMLGYFLFGPKLTHMQMQCFGRKRIVICTPECDESAEGTTPPLIDSSSSSESDFFICKTRTCIQPSHYFPASSQEGATNACHFGAKHCPSKVARAKKMQAAGPSHCSSRETTKEDSPSVEDSQLLRTERQGCCKKTQEPPPDPSCYKSSQVEAVVVHEPQPQGKKNEVDEEEEPSKVVTRENSPQIMCCHNTKSVTTDSQEQIIK